MHHLRARLDGIWNSRGPAAVVWASIWAMMGAAYFVIAHIVFKRSITNDDTTYVVVTTLVYGLGRYVFWKPPSGTKAARLGRASVPVVLWPPAPALVLTALCIVIAALIFGYMVAIMWWR
jgi:hypothetical protein